MPICGTAKEIQSFALSYPSYATLDAVFCRIDRAALYYNWLLQVVVQYVSYLNPSPFLIGKADFMLCAPLLQNA